MYVCMQVDMHKSIDVGMCAFIIYVCMHRHMYGCQNICMYVGKLYESIYVYIYLSMNVGRNA